MLKFKTHINNKNNDWVTFIHGFGGTSNIWYKQVRDLSKHYTSDTTTVTTSKKWTPEEDAIVIREYENNPKGYVDEAMKYLPERSRNAIKNRWSK